MNGGESFAHHNHWFCSRELGWVSSVTIFLIEESTSAGVIKKKKKKKTETERGVELAHVAPIASTLLEAPSRVCAQHNHHANGYRKFFTTQTGNF
jgi:hypothetical protein